MVSFGGFAFPAEAAVEAVLALLFPGDGLVFDGLVGAGEGVDVTVDDVAQGW